MRGSPLLLIVVAACGGTRYRTELVGHGNGIVSSRASDAAPGAGGVQLPQGNYELAMRFDVPRAQLVEWKIVCPGVSVDGQLGETLEQYRARRVAEIRRDRDVERARAAAAASIVVGAVAQARVDVRVAPSNDVIEIAPDDIGRGTLVASARVMTAGDGVCNLQVNADDAAAVRAGFTITRIRDLDAEGRMRTIAAREVAVKTRGSLSAQLVSAGADPAVHQPQTATNGRADVRARLEGAAIVARHEYLMYLSGKCNAEPGRRDRIANEEGKRREARLVAYAEIAQRRDQASMQARADLRAQLLRWGAKTRPPRPAPRPEEPGSAPFDGAEWTAGYWSWESDDWAWQDGGWTDPDLFGESGAGDVSIGGGGGSHTYETGVRDHRRIRDRVRDHRDLDDPPKWNPSESKSSGTRDHRDDSSSSNSRAVWTPNAKDSEATVRDHRDKDDKKDDDDKPRVRDHR